MIEPLWTRERIIAAIQDFAAENGGAPTLTDLMRAGAHGLPGRSTILRRFGSVAAAIDEAGVERRPQGRPKKTARLVAVPDQPVPELVPLSHMWYRTERVVAVVRENIAEEDIRPNLPSRLVRRFYSMTSGEQAYTSLPVVDALFTALDLHLWLIGEPDVICSSAPGGPGKVIPVAEAVAA